MDFDAYFHGFLESTVNLKQWKLDKLQDHVEAITAAFQADTEVGHLYKEHLPQGSWAHGTIIEPVGDFDEFDADVLLHLEPVPAWTDNPKFYLEAVAGAFNRHSTYKERSTRKKRCVRIQYAGDCHVDVVPAVTLDDGTQAIICHPENSFEPTDPVGFAAWMRERDTITNGELRRVIRLLKWLRDYKNTFTCPSVILTVMLGNRVRVWDTGAGYADLPTALVTLLEDLDAWLQSHQTMPLLDDPTCPGLNFNHRWNDPQYATFRHKIHDYAAWAREAYDLQADDEEAALRAWRKLFGDEFAADVVLEAKSAYQVRKATQVAESARIGKALVAAAPEEEWIDQRFTVVEPRYDATITTKILGTYPRTLRRGQPVRAGHDLRFRVATTAPAPYEVLWKVRNTGDAAEAAGDLRGKIFADHETGAQHREGTKYRGNHYIEVYIVKNGRVVASDHRDVEIV